MTTPEPTVRPTRYEVTCVPEDGFDSDVFAVTVDYRGRDLWAVTLRGHWCLSVDGEWDHEMRPSEREDDWLAAHRFPLKEAVRLAKEQAPLVTVNGHTVADALALAAARRAETTAVETATKETPND